jgi:tetratricopeptide (TPR) repeat protein/predicted Ser/Thr protein kinase
VACLAEERIIEYVEGRLSADDAAQVVAHTDGCDACRRLVAETAAALVPGSSTTAAPEPVDETRERSAPLDAGAAVGRYLLLGLVGSGGMGVVYAAYDPELDRKIALKLLRADLDAEDELRARLQREAQAMARLKHPNVIAVHDVGTFAGRVFIAMEFVAGSTLGGWARAGRRSWREVVRVLGAAGRGLEAAHAAGLVHRDFKPDNVLLGDDGRVCVTDFGLARPQAGEADVALDSGQLIGADSPLRSPLTREGALVGTPAYMAPEQMDGAPPDARADQFSFCVALYEALYGARPFQGKTVRALREAIRKEQITDPPDADTRRVPPWIRRVVVRGLRAQPQDRWPSMAALLDALERDPRRRVSFAVAAAVAVALTAAGAWGLRARALRTRLQCKGAEQQLAGVWSDARRARLRSVFVASGRPWAEESFAAVDAAFKSYGARWAQMRTDACEATRLRGEQSEELLDLRMQCLDERRRELEALVAELESADAALLDRAPQAAHSLTPLEGCAQAEALRARVRPPASRAARDHVQALKARLAETRALDDAGRYQQVIDRSDRVLDEARPIGYPPLEADALYMRGVGEDRLGRPKDASRTFNAAALAAARGRDDDLAARAWTQLTYVDGCELSRPKDGENWARYAEAAIDRLGGSDELSSNLLHSRGSLRWCQQRYGDAVEDFRRALQLEERVFGAEDYRIGGLLSDMGAVLQHERRLDEAVTAFERSIAVAERALGPAHPAGATPRGNLGVVRLLQRRLDEAEHLERRALELQQAGYGEDSLRTTWALNNLGTVLRLRGHADQALVLHRRALAIREQALGATNPQVLGPLKELGRDLNALGRPEEALPLLERAARLHEEKPSPVEHGEIDFAIAQALTALGREPARAQALAKQARESLASGAPVPHYRAELDEIDLFLKR